MESICQFCCKIVQNIYSIQDCKSVSVIQLESLFIEYFLKNFRMSSWHFLNWRTSLQLCILMSKIGIKYILICLSYVLKNLHRVATVLTQQSVQNEIYQTYVMRLTGYMKQLSMFALSKPLYIGFNLYHFFCRYLHIQIQGKICCLLYCKNGNSK